MDLCRNCKCELGSQNWPRHRQSKPDRICKDCYNDQARVYNKTNPFNYHNRDLAKTLLSGAKSRAKRKNLEFDLELDDIIIPDKCPVFGVPLERAEGGVPNDCSPTLDRLDSSQGYTKGNVQVISWKANRLKSNGTLEDFKAIIRWLEGVA